MRPLTETRAGQFQKPRWAKTLIPICIALTGLVVAAGGVSMGMAFSGACSSDCRLRNAFMLVYEAITTLVVVLALIMAWRLRRPYVSRALLVGGECVTVAAAAVIVGEVWVTTHANLLGSYQYQVGAMLPLLLWAPVCATAATAVVLIGNESRRLRNTALITLALASGYLLTFLAPATDAFAAGLHLHGVLHLPTRLTYVYNSNGGLALTSDVDPFATVPDGYLVTLFPGDYLVTEVCWNTAGTMRLGPDAHVPVHVSLGATTTALDACPPG